MRQIHKYNIVPGQNSLSLPPDAQFLSAQAQGPDRLMLWVLLDPAARSHGTWVKVLGTGQPIQPDYLDGMRYLSTAQLDGFVWHVWVPA